jgi:hypothetical protein
MSKRLTDVTKWTKNKWFRKLKPNHKLFWLYLLDNCDNVGVWEEDIELASILISYEYNKDEILKEFKDKVKVFRDGKKWWVKDFIVFQYGELKEEHLTNKPHQCYIRNLKKHRLWIDYTKTIHSLKEKEKDKDKDIEEDKEKEKIYRKFKHLSLSETEFESLKKKGLTKQQIDSYCDVIENYAKNKNYTSLNLTIQSWWRRDKKSSPSEFDNGIGGM